LPVTVVIDGRASALAEYHANGRKDPHVHAVVGTGAGGGIVSRGQQVLLPENAGGRLGHIKIADGPQLACSCGLRGCCEPLVAAPAIIRRYNSEAPAAARLFTLREIADSARAGDPLALSAFERSGYWLGIALCVVMKSLTPAAITIGGGVALASQQAGTNADPYLAGIKRGIRTACPGQAGLATLIRQGMLGNDAGIIGAAISSPAA
jgi:glucokinase